MTNMSYCRFENTLRDFLDCAEKLRELSAGESDDTLSTSEKRSAVELLKSAASLVSDMIEASSLTSERSKQIDIDDFADDRNDVVTDFLDEINVVICDDCGDHVEGVAARGEDGEPLCKVCEAKREEDEEDDQDD